LVKRVFECDAFEHGAEQPATRVVPRQPRPRATQRGPARRDAPAEMRHEQRQRVARRYGAGERVEYAELDDVGRRPRASTDRVGLRSECPG
jgi:hypothetical protein